MEFALAGFPVSPALRRDATQRRSLHGIDDADDDRHDHKEIDAHDDYDDHRDHLPR